MTEEEKKAIEKIKELEKLTREESKERNLKETQKLYKEYADYYLIILNLIEKLQKENERQQDIIIEKDRQLHLMHKEIQSVREQVWEITDKYSKDILMLNTPKIIIESKEDIKGLLDNYIPKDKIREYIKEKEEEKEGVKNISLEDYAITSKELKESEICLLKCLLEEE